MCCVLDLDGLQHHFNESAAEGKPHSCDLVFAGMSNMEGIPLTLRLICLLTKARSAGGMLTAFAALDRHATLLMAQQTCKTEPDL